MPDYFNVGFGYHSTQLDEMSAKWVRSDRPQFENFQASIYYDNPLVWYPFDEDAGNTYYNNRAGFFTPYTVTAADVGDPGNDSSYHSRRVPAGPANGLDTKIRAEDFKQLSFEFFFKSTNPSYVPLAYAPWPTDAQISGGQTQFSEYVSSSSNRAVSLSVQNINGAHRLAFAFSSLEAANGTNAGTFVVGGAKRMYALSSNIGGYFDGNWHHIIATWNGQVGTKNHADMFNFYIDGVELAIEGGEVIWDFLQTSSGSWEVPSITTDRSFIVTGTVGSADAWSAPYDVYYDDFLIFDSLITEQTASERQALLGQLNTAVEEDVAQPFATFTGGMLRTATEFDSTGSMKRVIEALNIDATSSITIDYIPLISDSLGARTVLPEAGSTTFSLEGTTVQPNEPNAGGYIGTRWYAIPFDSRNTVTVSLTMSDPSAASVVRFSVYKQTGLDEDDEPTITQLELVHSSDDSATFELDPYYNGMYFIQAGLLSGPGTGISFSWGGADPGVGGTFDGAIDIDGVTGAYRSVYTTNAYLEEGEPVSPTFGEERSIWFRWTAPDLAAGPITWTVIGTNQDPFLFEAYSGEELTDLILVHSEASDDGLAIQPVFEFTPGEIYYIRVATQEVTGIPIRLSWSPPRKEFVAADPVSHLRVTVHAGVAGFRGGNRRYEPNERITELPNRMGLQFQEALNVPGTGSLTVLQDDPIMRSFNPSYWPMATDGDWGFTQVQWSQDPYYLLRFGNIIKFWMNETCVSAFLIRSREVSIADGSENAAKTVTVSGPTVHYLLNDFIVEHARPEHMKEERQFDWASIAGRADLWDSGGWFDPGDGLNFNQNRRAWNHPINAASVKNPPGWDKKPNEAAKARPKYDLVRVKKPAWPDDSAKWIWMDENKDKNQSNFPPKRVKIDGMHYYRTKLFNITKDNKAYRFSVHSDTAYWVYVDGELFMSGNGNEKYDTFKQKRIWLDKGLAGDNPHTIAVLVDDRKETKKVKVKGKKRKKKKKIDLDHNDSFILTVWRLDKKGKPDKKIINTNKQQWYAWHGDNPPGWSRAMILRQVILEAQERGNHSALALSLKDNFGKRSEEGTKWFDEKSLNTAIEVGTSCLDIQAGFSETAQFDVWVDPNTLRVVAWQGGDNSIYPRGSNKSANVALVPGSNLINWTVSEVDEMKNRALVQFKGGYTYAENEISIQKHGQRDGFMEFGNSNSHAGAEELGDAVLASIASPSSLGGSGEIVGYRNETYSGSVIPVPGAIPFLDWNVGDSISAPSSNGLMRPHRVLSLSCTEDDTGNLTFDPELEAWADIEVTDTTGGGLL